MTAQAAIFDLDGTLTATNEIDSRCYVEAFEAEFGHRIDSDWSKYRHCTDEGITIEALNRFLPSSPSPDQIERLKSRFIGLLSAAALSSPHAFHPLPGAPELLQHLLDSGWIVRIATGAWRASARVKLAAAGLASSIPVFASDDCPARKTILSSAIASAHAASRGPLTRIVAVGDGSWDVMAAAELALPFVGIGSGDCASLLHEAGAQVVLADYSDLDGAVAHLRSAPAPQALPHDLPALTNRPEEHLER